MRSDFSSGILIILELIQLVKKNWKEFADYLLTISRIPVYPVILLRLWVAGSLNIPKPRANTLSNQTKLAVLAKLKSHRAEI